MSEFQEFPKCLVREGDATHIVVADEAGEAAARADGYELSAEIHARTAPAEAAAPKKAKK